MVQVVSQDKDDGGGLPSKFAFQAAFPLAKPLEQQSQHELNFANGSYIIGIPGGADQIRS
jgi:hypothetical protein